MKKILVVEDEQTLREDIVEILTFENYQALGAENGLRGLELARAERPDLIICDIMMPELDGYGVLIELHSDPATSHIPFVFLTAKTGRAEMRRGMELGADDYLTKPFTQPELVATIKARFEKQSNLTRIYEERLESLRSNVVRALPHELRTPLTGIMGYSSMLIEDIDSLDQAQIVQMAESIDRAARRLHRLTENYLLYAQIEFLQLDQPRLQALRQASTYDAELVIEDVAQLLGREYKRLDDLKIQLAPQANLQIANETLYKIIYEVIDNAFKFSSAGHTVELVSEWQEQTYCLQVRDQGRGMTPQQIDTIGAYMQFNRRVYEQAGLGLGLVIARRLLEVHHGRLEVTSTPPQGTIIWLYLPQATTTEGVT